MAEDTNANPQVTDLEEEKFGEPKKDAITEAKKIATGIKSAAENKAAIKKAKTKEEEEKSKSLVDYPSIFIDPEERIKVGVDILFDPENGRPLLMISNKLEDKEADLTFLRRVHEQAEFSHPTYNDVVTYREASMSWDKESRQFLADPVKMRIQFIRYHLKSLTLKDKTGKQLELKFDENDALTADCMKTIGKITPSLMDLILSEFERETLLG